MRLSKAQRRALEAVRAGSLQRSDLTGEIHIFDEGCKIMGHVHKLTLWGLRRRGLICERRVHGHWCDWVLTARGHVALGGDMSREEELAYV